MLKPANLKRLGSGVKSFIRKLLYVDLRVATYIFIGSRRSEYISSFITILSLIVALVQNTAAGLATVAIGFLIFLALVYTLTEAPSLRWHMLSYNICVRYDDDTDQRIEYTETMTAKSLRDSCNEIIFPLSYSGRLEVLQVIQDGAELPRKTKEQCRGTAGCYYVEERSSGSSTVYVKLVKSIKFGEQTKIIMKRRLEDAIDENYQAFNTNTIVDSFSLDIYFYLDRYPVYIECFEEFGLDRRPIHFKSQPCQINNHILEKVEFNSPKYLHKYGVKWVLPERSGNTH